MSAIKIGPAHFSGASNIHGKGGLSAVIRGMAIDLARTKVENANVPDLTDNSTGTAGSIVDLVVPTASFDASAAGGAQLAAFDTAMGKLENAGKVLVNSMNNVRARIGLPVLFSAAGTQASADTIPALDLTVTTASGTSAISFASGRASLLAAKDNVRKLIKSMNEIAVALGDAQMTGSLSGSWGAAADLVDIPAGAAALASPNTASIAKTVADAFLLAAANNIATIAARWNAIMFQTGLSDLTDSTGGTAAAGLAANTVPALAAGAATTSAPKAGFDAELAKMENNLADLTLRTNLLANRYGETLLTDSTGATANTTLEAMTVALTAVDGSTGTDAVDGVTARARMATVSDALSSIAAKINTMVDEVGVAPLTDDLDGTVSTTIANVAATAAGVGSTDPVTLLDADVDAWLVINRHNFATLAAKLNAMTGTEIGARSLSVVAIA